MLGEDFDALAAVHGGEIWEALFVAVGFHDAEVDYVVVYYQCDGSRGESEI